MKLVAGVVGMIVGFAIGILFTEVIFPNNLSWPDVVPFALAVTGWLAGTSFATHSRPH
jgi:hypothetical protein